MEIENESRLRMYKRNSFWDAKIKKNYNKQVHDKKDF